MPHIILEYSDNLADTLDVTGLLQAMHDTLAAQPGVDKARIKSRAVCLNDYIVGTDGANGHMLHASLLVLEGRDTATKKLYTTPLYELMCDAVREKHPDCAVTLEIRDMDAGHYMT